MFLQSFKYHIKQKNLLHQDMHTLKNREFSVGQIFAAFLRHLKCPSEKKIEPVVCRPLPGTRRNSFISVAFTFNSLLTATSVRRTRP